MSTIREAELFPISRRDLDAIRFELAVSRTHDDGRFTPHGTFRVIEKIFKNDRMMLDSGNTMWSPELLGLDAESLKLRVNQVGNVIVTDVQNNQVRTIYPSQIRKIDRLTGHLRGRQLVGESGYLLSAGKDIIGDKIVEPADIEALLVQAEKGDKPKSEFVDYRYFAIKVDPGLRGRELLRLNFYFLYPEPEWVKDAVVIDPQTGKLVSRKIYHPFAPHRWGK